MDRSPALDNDSLQVLVILHLLISTNEYDLKAQIEARGLPTEKWQARYLKHRFTDAEKDSYPDWLYDQGMNELGQRWKKIAQDLNGSAPVFIRANRLKTDAPTLKALLAKEGFPLNPVPGLEDALRLGERKNLFTSQAFEKGMFEVQDGASQKVALLLNLQPGMRLVDACAGAGGKTLHAAALMKNKGRIIALDVHDRKLDALRKRSARDGCDIIEAKVIEDAKTIKRLQDNADRLLLDVPCSGVGVIRRNPDTKWKLTPDYMAELLVLQEKILHDYCKIVKKGGIMVYSTCSILPSENEKQVEKFLADNSDFELLKEEHYWPGDEGFDGFYAAQMIRK